jgi:hypothetical protein
MVAILMVLLLIVTGFIQPVGAMESNSTVESSEPAEKEESVTTEECTEPVAKEESVTTEECTEPAEKEESVTTEESTEPAVEEESVTTEESTEPATKEENITTEESTEPAVEEESRTTDEISDSTGTVESTMTTEVNPNVLGNLMKDGNPLSGTSINIYHQAEDKWYNAVADQNGNFGFTVPDGEYQLQGIWVDSESKWYPLDLSFTVQDGVVDQPDLLQLDLSEKAPNANGSVMKDGQPVAGAWVNISTVTGEKQWFNAQTDENGKYKLDLPDGEYQIDDVWVGSESKLYPAAVSFTIQADVVANPEGLNLDLTEKAPNVNGTVKKDGQPLADVWVNMSTVNGEKRWFNAKTDENGKYKLDLPDGEYQIDGVWVESESKWYPFVVSFKVQDGAVINPDGLKFDLTEKGPNTNGSVMKDGQPVSDVWVSAHTVTGEEKWFNGKTDENGKFSMTLPDGEYQIEGIWIDSESKWYPSVIAFTVQNGEVVDPNQLHIDLSVKPSNVTGSVVKNGQPVAGVWVYAHTVTGEEIWFNGMTDENGNYGLTLPDGNFKIERIWVEEEQKWYPLSLNFSVVDGVLTGQSELLIDLSGEQDLNVKGSIKDENGKLANVDITINNVDTGEYFYSSTNEKGDFGLQLDDGQYNIELVVVDEAWNNPIYLDKMFSVENDQLQVAGVETELLDVTLPAFSLNVQLVNAGEPLNNIEVEIVQPNEKADRYMSKVVDENGITSFRLLDGEYRVSGYFEGGKFYYLNQTITVTNGTTNPNPFIIDVTNNGLTTLQGSLSDSNGFVGNSKVTFYNETIGDIFITDVNSEGSFSAELPNGEYSVESIYSDAFNYVYDVKVNTDYNRFSISEGIISVNGNEVEGIDLSIPAESLRVQVRHNGIPVQGSVLISSPTDSWYVDTNENGELTLRVPNGDYTIELFDDGVKNYPINRIAAANNENPVTLVIDLAEPEDGDGIVSGTVMDGSTALANAQFTIQDTNEYWNYYLIEADGNGKFSADILDGNYLIETVNDANGNPIASVDLFFSVANGKMTVNQNPVNELNVKLPSESLHVQILKNGTTLTGEVEITKIVSGYKLSYFVETNKNGEIVLRVPDGVYTISGLYEMEDPYDWYVINTEVEVLNGTTSPNPFVIDIEVDVDPPGYQGLVQDENGPKSGGFISIENPNGVNYDSFDVNENGEFTFDLQDGNYVVSGYWSPTIGDVILETHFSIQNGSLFVNGTAADQLIITLPSPIVTGVITDENGVAISGGQIGIFDVNDEETYSHYWVIDENGRFSLNLPDGEYKVTGITQDQADNRIIPLQISFSVQEGVLIVDGAVQEHLNIQLPKPNFTGQLVDAGQPVEGASIYFLSPIIPNYDLAFTVVTDEEGNFSQRLGDGIYAITGVSTDDMYFDIYIEFEVVNGIPSIDFSLFDVGAVQGNVQGQVQTKNGSAFEGGGHLDIVGSGERYDATLNGVGQFGIDLTDGNYIVDGLWSDDTGYITLKVAFSVQNGVLVGPLVVTLPEHY